MSLGNTILWDMQSIIDWNIRYAACDFNYNLKVIWWYE
jgi:hypothetical protein